MTDRRHQAREAALQVLYFCEVAGAPVDQAVETFFAEHLPDAAGDTRRFTAELVDGAMAEATTLDEMVGRHSQHWRLERLTLIDRLILRLATWELRHRPETPAAVVLNEAIELARTFSTDQSVKFVNGVLDAVRKTVDVQRS